MALRERLYTLPVATLIFIGCLLHLLPSAVALDAIVYHTYQTINASNFEDVFEAQTIQDPTGGCVDYVDMKTLKSSGLLEYTNEHRIILRGDNTTVVDANHGRPSFRFMSHATYGHGIYIFELRHMPVGCGAWPAIWTVKDLGWPNGGEIDIIEGVNYGLRNQYTIHASAGCLMPRALSRRWDIDDMSDMPVRSGVINELFDERDTHDCLAGGCGIQDPSTLSFGPGFNANGGGWYVLERTPDTISLWFFARNSANIPPEITEVTGHDTFTTQNWPKPTAVFNGSIECILDNKFVAHNIIINLTFCGSWAGNAYSTSGCPGTCVDFVKNTPGNFTDAYFDIGVIRIYSPP